MKNKLIDLNDHLFTQLERLGDEDISDEELDKEITRAKSISDISKNIISNASLALKVEEFKQTFGYNASGAKNLPTMLEHKNAI